MRHRFTKMLAASDLAAISTTGKFAIVLVSIGVSCAFYLSAQVTPNESKVSSATTFFIPGAPSVEEAVDPSLPAPAEKIDPNGYHMPEFSIDEAKRLSAEAVVARRTTYRMLNQEKDFAQTRKAWVIALARTGEPNAEYLVGSMYEEWSNSHNSPQAAQRAIKWYERALLHGSTAAAGQLGEMYWYSQDSALPNAALSPQYLQKSADGGDPQALIEVAQTYENKNTPEDLQKAMALYEQAANCNDEYNAEEARRIIARLWLLNRGQPSEDFRKGESDVFDYVCKYGSFWEAASLARAFETRSNPTLLDQTKSTVLRKISESRLEAARKDPKMSRKVELWDSLRTFCWSIGKSVDVFQ